MATDSNPSTQIVICCNSFESVGTNNTLQSLDLHMFKICKYLELYKIAFSHF